MATSCPAGSKVAYLLSLGVEDEYRENGIGEIVQLHLTVILLYGISRKLIGCMFMFVTNFYQSMNAWLK